MQRTSRLCAWLGVSMFMALGACTSARSRPVGADSEASTEQATADETLAVVEKLARREPAVRAIVSARTDGFMFDKEANEPARYVSPGWRAARENRFGDLGARLPTHAAGTLEVGVSRFAQLRVGVELLGASSTSLPRESAGRIVYHQALPETDRVVAATSAALEELLVLRSDRAPHTFTWRVTLPGGIAGARASDGSIDFVDIEGKVSLRVSAPFALDGHGMRHTTTLAWSASERTMTLAVPEGLAFPVVLDPVYQSGTFLDTLQPPARDFTTAAFDAARGELILFGGQDATTGRRLRDTWRWSGSTWSKAGGAGPSARSYAKMVYDETRKEILLFGGVADMGVLGDTWRWDGSGWTELSPATSPTPRFGHAMAYDAARKEVVLFDGVQDASTWLWNGTTWRKATPATSPPFRTEHAMAFDAVRNEVLLYGGFGDDVSLSDTWKWNGTTWNAVAGAPGAPPAIGRSAMVFDIARGEIVLFGGSANGPSGTTHLWNGVSWRQASPATSPSPRGAAAMAFDSVRNEAVLFGGDSGGPAAAGETWRWNGTNWSKPPSPAFPPARSGFAMAFDGARGDVILFGGIPLFGAVQADTWRWNGVSWALLSPANSPPPRAFHAMAYDAKRAEIVLFAGRGALDVDRNDTWRWNGTNWVDANIAPASSPPSREQFAMAYDEKREETVVFSGRGAPADTWRWNGTAWSKANPATSPSAREHHAMAYDGARAEILLFAGAPGLLADTWKWNGVTWTQLSPVLAPSPRNRHTMSYDAALREVILFTGQPNGTPIRDVWHWNGAIWKQQNQPLPTELNVPIAVYDGARHTHVLVDETTTYLYATFGGTCTTTNDCRAGTCVDDVCCAVPKCGSCETCGGVIAGECTAVLNTEDADTCAVASGKSCNGTGVCKAALGTPAAIASDCASAILVDGVCCDTKCDGACLACRADLKESGTRSGICDFARSGTDLRDHCNADPTVSCQQDGTCDGRGGCRLYTSGVGCGAVSCIDNRAAGRICTGLGQCADSAQGIACGAYACVVDAGCRTSCNGDADCGPVHKCELPKAPASGAAGVCVPTGANACLDDHSVKRFDGTIEECGFSKCRDGACVARCTSLADCVYPNDCAPDGRCVGFSSDPAVDLGACAVTRAVGGGPWGPAALFSLGLVAMIALARRRRPRTRVRARGRVSRDESLRSELRGPARKARSDRLHRAVAVGEALSPPNHPELRRRNSNEVPLFQTDFELIRFRTLNVRGPRGRSPKARHGPCRSRPRAPGAPRLRGRRAARGPS